MEEEKCENCKFWLGHAGDDGVSVCRRYPPVVFAEADDTSPLVGEDDWCGEYKPIEGDSHEQT